MIVRDRWVEILRCPQCGKTGSAELSTADGQSWAVKVDRIPEGFNVIESENSSNFHCDFCNRPVEP